ncbi:MAG: putative DNA binding domain-containing protein, partial [Methanomassiliicoccaceae archaeon]|nr:putative DNA binding domain-containing protein [Methanomassiliicoccaceae archaeon]
MESQSTEYKESWRKEYLDTICAFANTDGGTMVIGKDDKGNTVGIRNSEKLLTEIPNTVRNVLRFSPEVRAVTENGKTLVYVTVMPQEMPVDFGGLHYIRSGSTTVNVTGNEQIRFLLRKMNLSWTDFPANSLRMRDLSQDALKFFIKKGLSSNRMSKQAAEDDIETLLRNYHLMENDELHNSADVLFRGNPNFAFSLASIKIGDLNDDGRLLRHDQIDYPGVLQPDRVMDVLLNKYLRGVDELEGLMMVTKYPYPERALREAVMNLIIHREYFGQGYAYIKVYPNRIEMTNPGYLPKGWTTDDLYTKHNDALTNPAIANVFFTMGYVEKWGSGIKMMRDECLAMNLPEPEYEMVGNYFQITFRLPEKKIAPVQKIATVDLSYLTETESKVYALICAGNLSTTAEISDALNISVITVKRAAAKLVDGGY